MAKVPVVYENGITIKALAEKQNVKISPHTALMRESEMSRTTLVT